MASALASPMPDAAPVTAATLPAITSAMGFPSLLALTLAAAVLSL